MTGRVLATLLRPFFRWYNTEHRHSGIAFMRPKDVHYGREKQIMAARSATLDTAFEAHPERFKGKRPRPKSPPQAVWINHPDAPEQVANTERLQTTG